MTSLESRQTPMSKKRVDRIAVAEPEATSGSPSGGRSRIPVWLIAGILFLAGTTAGATSAWWWPPFSEATDGSTDAVVGGPHAEALAAAAEADPHAHAPTGGETLTLSEHGRKNIGLTLATVSLQDFVRTVSMPATIVSLPGQTEIAVSAPMTGIVTQIYTMRGEAVLPGAPMFDLRLTHEDLVEKQSSLLRSLEEQDVVKREVARLEDVTASGAVAGKRLLERQYEQQKIEARIRAEQQALLLHGLTSEQIKQIVDQRQLLQMLTILAPPLSDSGQSDGHVEYLQVADIPVNMGEHVATGTQLATVTDHCELLIEGKAFEHDAASLSNAANAQAEVTALIDTDGTGTLAIPNLQILYIGNQVERDSRALKFYVRLPNELVRNEQSESGHRFIGWRYRPGQRVELMVPVEQWEKCIVLPIDAIVMEGPEAYVYLEHDGIFERKPVHVEYRDQRSAVIESDGSLFPGDKVAEKGAYQIHLALKNKAGGGADPHAGHHH